MTFTPEQKAELKAAAENAKSVFEAFSDKNNDIQWNNWLDARKNLEVHCEYEIILSLLSEVEILRGALGGQP